MIVVQVNDRKKSGPLMEAVCHNNAAALECNLNNATGKQQHLEKELHRALWVATAHEKFHLSRILLDYGADPNTICTSGSSVLHCALDAAFSSGDDAAEFARLLLERGADPNVQKNRNGQIPLTLSIYTQQLELIRLLLSKGAHVDAKCYPSASGQLGETPLYIISGYKSNPFGQNNVFEITSLLLDHGANVHETCGKTMDTPLFRACRWGQDKVANLLLEHGANPNATDTEDNTPLHYSLYNSLTITQILLDNGAGLSVENKEGRTPLHMACCSMQCKLLNSTHISSKDQVELLLQYGADPSIIDNQGYSVLDHAACHPAANQMIPLLLHYAVGAGRNIDMTFALHQVAKDNDKHRALCALLKHGANAHSVDKQGNIPLYHACQNSCLDNIYDMVMAMVGLEGGFVLSRQKIIPSSEASP